MTRPSDSSYILVRWLLGIFSAFIILWVGSIQAQITTNLSTDATQGERIATLETIARELRPQLAKFDLKLDEALKNRR